jgi:hypothetical protein
MIAPVEPLQQVARLRSNLDDDEQQQEYAQDAENRLHGRSPF